MFGVSWDGIKASKWETDQSEIIKSALDVKPD